MEVDAPDSPERVWSI
jgi:hypothetical protein